MPKPMIVKVSPDLSRCAAAGLIMAIEPRHSAPCRSVRLFGDHVSPAAARYGR